MTSLYDLPGIQIVGTLGASGIWSLYAEDLTFLIIGNGYGLTYSSLIRSFM